MGRAFLYPLLTQAALGQDALADGADVGGAVHDRCAGGGQRPLLRLGWAAVNGGLSRDD